MSSLWQLGESRNTTLFIDILVQPLGFLGAKLCIDRVRDKQHCSEPRVSDQEWRPEARETHSSQLLELSGSSRTLSPALCILVLRKLKPSCSNIVWTWAENSRNLQPPVCPGLLWYFLALCSQHVGCRSIAIYGVIRKVTLLSKPGRDAWLSEA